MDKLKLHTPDFAEANAAKLADLFPSCVTETQAADGSIKRAIDFDLLRQELSSDLVEGPQERYRLDWPGKREALALANAPVAKTLRPCKEESVDFETTRNLYIEGDNLDALKLLQETYLNQVKMIYIDPPYNTGKDFIYDDNFSMSREEYEERAGEVDETGNAMFDEEKWQQNSSASGRFHSEWLSMLYPRLKLSKNLLKGDGVIFISVDDNEVANLKRLCDEVFGGGGFLGLVPVVNNAKGRNDKGFQAQTHEYMVVYQKSDFTSRGVAMSDEKKSEYDCVDEDGNKFQWRDLRKRGGADTRRERPNLYYPIYVNPENGSVSLRSTIEHSVATYPVKSDGEDGRWRWKKETAEDRIDLLLARQKRDSSWGVSYKVFLGDDFLGERREKTKSAWVGKEFSTDSGTKTLNSLIPKVDGKQFTPKPVGQLLRICEIATDESDLILDFFSGTATTAHAVMQMNAEDGGNRRHILVQLPEPCDPKSQAFKSGYQSITDIGKERVRRAGVAIRKDLEAKLAKAKPGSDDHGAIERRLDSLDTGFRVLKIDSSNMAEVYYQPDQLTQDALALQVDNVKKGRKPEDLLFQVLLNWGVDLGLPITEETIEGKKVFFVDDNALAACFDTGLTEGFCKALAKREPLRAVFRDAGYASDATKINIEQIFKTLSPHTELKTL
ncbi:adenine-specific DNA-methyltransferase [Haloferula luteola]|uniref:site-specific DNA-methyltransferase (adenine-specific) n=1 Tax=Haloferula luteola TaxID=595692 RepID=A0A840V724_9BACT|nr:site-specific DNA-methyltransferase [Haloferula luteola]MBB5353825.1 adenine-specific DNA-methyltransferase [Haloferula luteola]